MSHKDVQSCIRRKATTKVTMAIPSADLEALRIRGDKEGSDVYEMIRRLIRREVRRAEAAAE